MGDIDTSREAVERLLDGVTEGPWLYRPGHYDDWGVVKAQDCQICQARHPDRLESKVLSEYRANGLDPWEANARFIAAARELVPALLARAEAAEAKLADWQASQHYRYIGKDGKPVLARDLEAALAAERETVARLTEALTLAANRLHRRAVDFDTGSRAFIETSEWAEEARAALTQKDRTDE